MATNDLPEGPVFRTGDHESRIAGERLRLLPERAIYWMSRETLVLADPHFGKGAAFRAGGVPVPGGTTKTDVSRLEGLVRRLSPRRMIILGDLLHAPRGRTPEALKLVTHWRQRWSALEVLLVRGNHDLRAGDPPVEWNFKVVDEPYIEGPFEFRHRIAKTEGLASYQLAGHVHPAVRLAGVGRQRERLPCFLFGRQAGLVPAFGSFTGHMIVRPSAGERVFVIAGSRVMPVD